MSSESSSEEEINKFREAVDGNFFTEDLYKNSKLEKKPENSPQPTQSLRNTNHEAVSFNPFSIKVTPEFQKHVSQHLTRLLDNSIDDSKPFLKVRKFKKRQEAGVKLLGTSKNYLCSYDSISLNKTPKKQLKTKSLKNADYEMRAKQVAVSPEWVLSKKELEHWAPNTKGEVEVVRLSTQNKRDEKKKQN